MKDAEYKLHSQYTYSKTVYMHSLMVLHEKVGFLKVCLDIIRFSNPQFTPDTSAFRVRSNSAVEVGGL